MQELIPQTRWNATGKLGRVLIEWAMEHNISVRQVWSSDEFHVSNAMGQYKCRQENGKIVFQEISMLRDLNDEMMSRVFAHETIHSGQYLIDKITYPRELLGGGALGIAVLEIEADLGALKLMRKCECSISSSLVDHIYEYVSAQRDIMMGEYEKHADMIEEHVSIIVESILNLRSM